MDSGAKVAASDETKIVYHVDEEKTPYLIKLPISADKVTLADLKTALNKPNFKYFFKSQDDDFGVVKEEITDDSKQLPYFNGRVVCWLVSSDGSVLSDSHVNVTAAHQRQNSSIDANLDNHLIPSEPRPSGIGDSRPPSFHGGVGRSPHAMGSPVNVGDSDTLCDTCTETEDSIYGIGTAGMRPQKDRVPPLKNFGRDTGATSSSRHRAGGSAAVYGRYDTSTSMMSSDLESTSFFDSEDESSRFSTATGTTFSSHRYGRHRQQRRRRRLPPISRASSFSSVTESSMSLNIVTVTLNMQSVSFLGISIVGQSNRGSGDGGIYVGSIMKGGAVAQDGRIQPGDMILEVNSISFESMSNDEAVRALREQVQRPGPIKLTVAKCWDSGTLLGAPRHTSPPPVPPMNMRGGMNANSSHNATTVTATEAVRPIDPRAWLLHTNASMEQAAMNAGNFMHSGNVGGPGGVAPSIITTSSSLPESEHYLLQQQGGALAMAGGGDSYPLSIHSDIHAIVRAMSSPDSGLEVRDRLWLKIVLPRAFIGSDLVDWLYRMVQGFQERREARKYAAQLLKFGYIRHTVNKVSFSEQCYYVFGDMTHTFSRLSLEEEVDSVSQIGAQPPVMPTVSYNNVNQPKMMVTPLPPPTWQHTASTGLTASQQNTMPNTAGGNSSQYSSVASPPLFNSPGFQSSNVNSIPNNSGYHPMSSTDRRQQHSSSESDETAEAGDHQCGAAWPSDGITS